MVGGVVPGGFAEVTRSDVAVVCVVVVPIVRFCEGSEHGYRSGMFALGMILVGAFSLLLLSASLGEVPLWRELLRVSGRLGFLCEAVQVFRSLATASLVPWFIFKRSQGWPVLVKILISVWTYLLQVRPITRTLIAFVLANLSRNLCFIRL